MMMVMYMFFHCGAKISGETVASKSFSGLKKSPVEIIS
jgi:hypothetical protein